MVVENFNNLERRLYVDEAETKRVGFRLAKYLSGVGRSASYISLSEVKKMVNDPNKLDIEGYGKNWFLYPDPYGNGYIVIMYQESERGHENEPHWQAGYAKVNGNGKLEINGYGILKHYNGGKLRVRVKK